MNLQVEYREAQYTNLQTKRKLNCQLKLSAINEQL